MKRKQPPPRASNASPEEIRRAMTKHQLSREQLAEILGVKVSTLGNIILGHQNMGAAASTAVRRLLSDKSLTGPSNALSKELVRQAVAETAKLLLDKQAFASLETLAKTQQSTIVEVTQSLVTQKVLPPDV